MSKEKFELVITDEQIEIMARRLLPVIKRYMGNEEVQKEFEAWKRKQHEQENQAA